MSPGFFWRARTIISPALGRRGAELAPLSDSQWFDARWLLNS
jgi:hypothetical protein